MVTRRGALLRLGALGGGAAAVWWVRERVLFPTPQPRFPAGGDGSGWLNLPHDTGLLAVSARVDGRPTGALIDSGAQTSVLDRAAAERLGVRPGATLPLLAYGVSGAPQFGRAAAADVALGALDVPQLRLAILDLGPIVEATGGRVELVIGQDLLRRVSADIDLDRRRLALRPPGTRPPGVLLRSLPVRLRGRELAADAIVEGRAIEAVVDTGSSAALSMSEPTARTAGLLASERALAAQAGVTFGGATRNAVVRARVESLAGVPVGRELAVQVFRNASAPAPAALIGLAAFEGRRIVLDLGRGELALAEGRAVGLGLTR